MRTRWQNNLPRHSIQRPPRRSRCGRSLMVSRPFRKRSKASASMTTPHWRNCSSGWQRKPLISPRLIHKWRNSRRKSKPSYCVRRQYANASLSCRRAGRNSLPVPKIRQSSVRSRYSQTHASLLQDYAALLRARKSISWNRSYSVIRFV